MPSAHSAAGTAWARACAWGLLVLATACGRSAPAPGATAGHGLRVAIVADEGTLQPYTYVTGYPGWNMLSLVYDTLFLLDASNQPQPWVATHDTVSQDGRTHTLSLRPDVRWHDGRPLTSADVKFAYEYYQTHPHGRWTPPVSNVARIETPDASTVVISLTAPDPSFAIGLLAELPIIPKHIWAGVADPKSVTESMGSGPYRLSEYRPGEFYRLVANRDYFAGAPGVAELQMPVLASPAAVFASLDSGEIHATTVELPAELLPRFQNRPGIALSRGAGFGTTLLQFNTGRAPWNQAAIRQAVALAIDTRRLVDMVLLGQGTPGNPGWVHPGSPLHDAAIVPTYDVGAARALLDRAGIIDRNGDGVREWEGSPLAPTLLVQANNPMRIRAAELIAAAVKTIGIEVHVRAEEAGSVTAKVWPEFDVSKSRNFEWAMWGWSAPILADPLRVVSLVASDPHDGANNIGGYRSAEADAIAAQLRTTLDVDRQRALIRQLEAVIARDRPFVLLWYADQTYAYAPAAYDRWVFQTGQGIFNKRSFVAPATR